MPRTMERRAATAALAAREIGDLHFPPTFSIRLIVDLIDS